MLNDVASAIELSEELQNNKITLLSDDEFLLNQAYSIESLTIDNLKSIINHIIISIPTSLIQDSLEFAKELNSELTFSDYVIWALRQYNKKFQIQHLTTSSLRYNGRKPRRDVLEKLEKIIEYMKKNVDYPILTQQEIIPIIKSALGNLDSRTVNHYKDCLINFVEEKMDRKLNRREELDIAGIDLLLEKLMNDDSNLTEKTTF